MDTFGRSDELVQSLDLRGLDSLSDDGECGLRTLFNGEDDAGEVPLGDIANGSPWQRPGRRSVVDVGVRVVHSEAVYRLVKHQVELDDFGYREDLGL